MMDQHKRGVFHHSQYIVYERTKLAERQRLAIDKPTSYMHISIDGSAGYIFIPVF